MKFVWQVCLCLMVAGSFATASAQEKPADEVIKINTALVSVPVIVSDRQGRYIPDLTRKDFVILQDGRDQRIEFFAAVEEPFNVALLIDTSQSTRRVIGDIKSAARKFIKMLRPDDRAMIGSFDFSTHLLCSLTSDQKQLEKAIKSANIPEEFGTTLRDAVAETIEDQFAGVTGRKAIILLTDGKDHGSRVSTAALEYSLQETDVIVYTVLFSTGLERPPFWPDGGERRRGGIYGGGRRGGVWGDGFPGDERFPRFPRREDPRRRERVERQNEEAGQFLQKLSELTAGRFYESKSSKLNDVFSSIVDELRHQYRLGYYPTDDADNSPVHTIRVKVMRPELAVRARTSYRRQTASK
jgi:VWFA-related protein